MNIDKFMDKYLVASEKIDMKKIRRILNKSIDANSNKHTFRGYKNLIIVMEELSELIQAISKKLRYNCEYDVETALLEEYADVVIGLIYIQEIVGYSDDAIKRAINVKMDRLENSMNKNNKKRTSKL